MYIYGLQSDHNHQDRLVLMTPDLPHVIQLVDVIIQAANEGKQQHHLDNYPVQWTVNSQHSDLYLAPSGPT